MNRTDLDKYITETYNTAAEFPWLQYPSYAVYRNKNNNKWFAVIMEIPISKLGGNSNTNVNVVNLKCDPILIGSLLSDEGIYKGYHMNKNHWITVQLDSIADTEKIKWLLDMSFNLTSK